MQNAASVVSHAGSIQGYQYYGSPQNAQDDGPGPINPISKINNGHQV